MKRRLVVMRGLPAALERWTDEKLEIDVFPEDRAPSPAELKAWVQDADGVVALLSDRFDATLIDACPRLRVIANYAVGYDNIDAIAAAERGIWVTNTPDVLTDATADLTWALILGLARRLREAESVIREGRVWEWKPGMLLGRELRGATLGILGFGRIGQAVARRAQGFGMQTIVTTRRTLGSEASSVFGVEQVSFDELLERSEVLSIHCPLTDQTFHRFGEDEFRRMRRDAYVINTARGPIVDEAALVRALEEGQLAGAGLDVFEREPCVEPGLVESPRVMLLPHIGSATEWTRGRMAEIAMTNAVNVLLGGKPLNPVCAVPNPR